MISDERMNALIEAQAGVQDDHPCEGLLVSEFFDLLGSRELAREQGEINIALLRLAGAIHEDTTGVDTADEYARRVINGEDPIGVLVDLGLTGE